MSDKIFDVTFTITKTVRVRVPDDPLVVYPGEDPEDVAEEFAMAGKEGWSEFVLSEESDYEVESVRYVPPDAEATLERTGEHE